MWNRGMPFMHRARGKASVLIEHYPNPAPDDFDPELAAKFTYITKNPVEFCVDNALVAALHGRGDYRRILESLAVMLKNKNVQDNLWNEDTTDEKLLKLHPMIKGIHKMSVSFEIFIIWANIFVAMRIYCNVEISKCLQCFRWLFCFRNQCAKQDRVSYPSLKCKGTKDCI